MTGLNFREEIKLRILSLNHRGIAFHGDDDYSNYVDMRTDEDTFTDAEVDELNRMREECSEAGFDINEIGMEALMIYRRFQEGVK